MIDRQQLAAVQRLRGFNNAKLGAIVGTDGGNIFRIKSHQNPSFDLHHRLASALHMPPADLALNTEMPRPWTYFTRNDEDDVTRLNEMNANVDSSIAIIRGMYVYLQPEPQLEWTFTRAHQAAGWTTEQISNAFSTLKRTSPSLESRLEERSAHRVLARRDWFDRTYEQEPGWLEENVRILRELDGDTVLGLLDNTAWEDHVVPAIKRLAQRYLRPAYVPLWDKLLVGDTSFAYFRFGPGRFAITYHRPFVEHVRLVLEKLATLVPYSFPADSSDRDSEDSIDKCIVQLQHIATNAASNKKGPPPLEGHERAYWKRLAFQS